MHGDTTMRVACIGDSLTEVSGYPSDLQTLLGTFYNVENFGVSSTTVQLDTYKPYMYEAAFVGAKNFKPNIAVIMLGTNDARNDCAQSLENFTTDYIQLIDQFQALDSRTIVFIVIPTPIFQNSLVLNSTIFAEQIIPLIEQVAAEKNLPVVDVYSALQDYPGYFPDGVHPTSEGAQIIANQVYQAILDYAETY